MANEAYGGFWYNEVENTLVFCIMNTQLSGSDLLVYPSLFLVEQTTNTKTQIYPPANEDLSVFIVSNMTIDHFERPVVTFNSQTGIYNVAMLSFSTSEDVWLHDIDLVQTSRYRTQLKDVKVHILNAASDTAIINAANTFDDLINITMPGLFPA